MRSTKTIFLVLAAGLALLFAGQTLAAVGRMPLFSLPSAADGTSINVASYQGQVILVNFFTTWCPPCRKEIPSFIQLQKDYGPQGFTVIGISTDQEPPSLVDNFAKKMGVNYPVVIGSPETSAAFGGIFGIPTSFLVDRAGNIVRRYDGYVSHQALEQDLKGILQR